MWSRFLTSGYSELITSGCDSRLRLSKNGLNRYGCGCVPRDEIALGSCSCSTPSPRGTAAAKELIAKLRSTQTPKSIIADAAENIRRSLRSYMRLDESANIALTPSGTDAELLAAALADRDPRRPILNLVVGPDEVGSGTVRAASGEHYDSRVPRGGSVTPGTPVDRTFHRRVRSQSILIREADGTPRLAAEIDAEIHQLVTEAVDQGYQVILHAVAHSKTGCFAPRLETIRRIQGQLSRDVVVFVDAAQGRLGEAFNTVSISELVDLGCMINFTGSKFFAGPPFSAALVVPNSMGVSERTRGLPSSFGDYFSRDEMPPEWAAIRRSMDSWTNLPALVRWTAAISEINAFKRVPSHQLAQILERFERSAKTHLSAQAAITPLPTFDHGSSDWASPNGSPATTVLSFAVGSPTHLDRQALLEIRSAINHGTTQGLPIQLGQPVQIAPGHCVLRVALSAPLVVRIAEEDSVGATLRDRLRWLDRMLEQTAAEIAKAAGTLSSECGGQDVGSISH